MLRGHGENCEDLPSSGTTTSERRCAGSLSYGGADADFPDLATLEGSSWTDIMTCTGGCGYSF